MRICVSVLIGGMILFGGCSTKQETPLVRLTFYNNNVLLPNVEFETSTNGEVLIEYWPLNKPSKLKRSMKSVGIKHNIVLSNLKGETQYRYIINNLTTGSKSAVLEFETSKIPFDVVTTKKTLIDTTQFAGYILIRKLAPLGVDAIIDKEGDIVWYYLYDTAIRRPFVWTKAHSVLSQYDSAQIVEHDLHGNVIMDLKLMEHGISNMLHHEVLLNDRNEVVALTLDSVKVDLRKVGGKKDQYVRADGIIVFTKEGEKKWEWNLLNQYLPTSLKQIMPNQSLGHANSMVIANDGNYVVSFRDFSQIWKINSSDGSIMWKLGKGGDFRFDDRYSFIGQHSIHFNSRGELMLFDNGDKMEKQNSRVLSFKLDEAKRIAEPKIVVNLPQELSAFKMCSAELIANGKYLICTSKKNGIISVVNDDATVLWRVDLSSPSYRAYYLENPFER